MWFRDVLVTQREFLLREKQRIVKELKRIPKGKLIKRKSRNKTYYYLEDMGKRKSLFKEPELRDQMLLGEILRTQLNAIDRNVILLERAIRTYRPLVQLNTIWSSIESQQNSYHAENRVHVYRGVAYRSKSEMLIAMALTSYGIEFKYEGKMEVGGRYIYPDFIIKRPIDGKIFIWEHFGRMDLEDYRRKSFNKLEDYHYQGFDLWINFIISFDQGAGSINMDYIDKIIKLNLL